MMMLEAEAAEKICCARVTVKCLASACMAWRWDTRQNTPSPPDPNAKGYCGLCSTPED